MEYLRFSAIDYLLFVFMFGLSCIVGIYFGCCSSQLTTTDYFLGGRKLKVFPVAMSMVASTLSGVGLLGVPAEVYMHGTQISFMVIAIFIMGIVTNYVYLPVFYKLRISSAYQYLEIRFDNNIKIIASLLYTLTCILFLPLVIYAPSLAFTQGIDLHIIAPIMSVICIFYTTIGGLKAVVWTDTLQFSITLCTLAIVLVIGLVSVGGFATVWEKAQYGNRIEFFNIDPDPTVRCTLWSIVVGSIFSWLGFLSINPSGVQRFVAVPKLSDAKKSLAIFTVFASIAKLISCFSGLIIYTKYFDCDPLSAGYIKKIDQIVPYYVVDIARKIPGISGLFIAGLFSTALSTLSTHLNTVSGILYMDIIQPKMPADTSENKASTIIKILTILIGLITVGLLFVIDKLGSIFEYFHCAQGITGGPVLGLFTLGMLFPMANRKGALVGVTSSLILTSVIIIKNQMYIWNGDIKFIPKPLNSYGCNKSQSGYMDIATTTVNPSQESTELPFWLYRITFHYYYLLGTMFTLVIGLITSVITKNKNDLDVPSELLSPFVSRLLGFPKQQTERIDQDMKTITYTFNDK